MKNHAENVHQKLAPGSFFILVNNPKQILLKIRYLERGLSKTLQKVNFIFSFKPIPFNVQSYQKQKGPGTSDQSLFRLPNKFTKIYLLVIYYLTKFDGVLYSGFWLIPKITPANLCKLIHDIIYYSSSICPFESAKWGNEGEKLQKIEYLEKEKSFLGEIKKKFHSFWRAIVWWKK